MLLVLGIDPGKDGGFAALNGDGMPEFVECMPDTEASVCRMIRIMVETCRKTGEKITGFIEKAEAWPGQSVVATKTTCTGYGLLLGGLMTMDVPVTQVRGNAWRKKVGLTKKAKTKAETKLQAVRRAHELFPSVNWQSYTKAKRSGIADALLIAFSGLLTLRGDAHAESGDGSAGRAGGGEEG